MWRHVLFFFFFFFPGIPWWYSCWASLYHATLWSHRKIMIVFNLITFPNFRNISCRVYLAITFTGCFNIWLATLKKLAVFFTLPALNIFRGSDMPRVYSLVGSLRWSPRLSVWWSPTKSVRVQYLLFSFPFPWSSI